MTVHVVKRGENLSTIAKLYSTTIDRLTTVNSIRDANKISVGQSLNIPAQRQYSAPPATLKPADESKKPSDTSTLDLTQRVGGVVYQQLGIWHGILDALLQRFRTAEANESVQHSENAKLTRQTQPVKNIKEAPKNKHSQSNVTLDDAKKKLKEQLGKEPLVVTFSGVKLTENEKKQIMASVAVCEMNKDGFGSMNSDQEFRGRKFGQKGIETGYSRIVHIGLSYGVIQFTQDGGMLGKVLKEMQSKNPSKFSEVFGGGDASIAENLIVLCTTGRSDLASDTSVPVSGQLYWNTIKKKPSGKEISNIANEDKDQDGKSDLPKEKEIRGKRVQPIKASKDELPTDIWTGTWRQRFQSAGQITDFQEAQIQFAVNNFMNPMLKTAKDNNLRSAIGLAFFTACSVRFGASQNDGTDLIFDIAKELGLDIPFKSSGDEIKAIKAIAESKSLNERQHQVGSLKFDKDEQRRAKLLLKDELGFLSEDIYDVSTY